MPKASTILVALLACTLASCGDKPPPPPPPPSVSVAQPLKRNVVDWDEYVGRFEAVEDVELRARVSGVITRVLFRDGQDVGRGQALFVIDPRPFEAALAQARAEVARAEATLANARTELDRAQKLLDLEAVSQEEYETKLAARRTASAALSAAAAAARARELDLSFTRVSSPIAGRVSDRKVSLGDYVSSGDTVLTRVVTIDPIWFRFEGAESFYLKYLRQDRAGTRGSSRYSPNPVEVGLADESGYPWRGRMDFIDNALDTNSGTIRAHAVIPNPDRFLTPGMFGRARLLGSGTYPALLIPDEAIATDQTRKLAYVVGKDGKVAPRPLVIGPQVEGLRVVREGLVETDLVILDGLSRVQPGMAVVPKRIALRPRAADTAPMATPSVAPSSPEASSAN